MDENEYAEGEVQNTDREVYRSPEDAHGYSAERVLITEGGGLGVDVNGSVYVKPVAEWHNMAEHREKAHFAQQAAMQSHVGIGYTGPNAYQPSPEEAAEQRERNRKYEEGVLRQYALNSAIQYAVGREVSAAQIVKDAQAFLDFLTVK